MLEQQQTARRQAAATATTNNDRNNNNSTTVGQKEFDLPPAYAEVTQSYLTAKQQQLPSENNLTEGVSTNNISPTVSTLTIETEISNSQCTSAMDLNNSITLETTVINSAMVNPLATIPPPTYNQSIEMSITKPNNDHIV